MRRERELRESAPANLLLLGKGGVGTQVMQRLDALGPGAPKLVGVADSRGAAFDRTGLDARARKHLTPDRGPAQARLTRLLDELALLPCPVLVDCTAADLHEVYAAAFERGVHVVTANKKVLAGSWRERERLLTLKPRGCHLRYETTVGAALPVIGTLQDLVRTGDEVQKVVACLSGTIGHIIERVEAGVPLSRAIRQAHKDGLTEPNPRDDLSGLDVARKAVILARELDMKVSLDDVAIEPFIPQPLLDAPDVETLCARIEPHDAEFGARIRHGLEQGIRSCYVAIINRLPSPSLRASTWQLKDGHPYGLARGRDAGVAIWSAGNGPTPVRVLGPGAGAYVTAGGVLADILAIQRTRAA